MSKPNAVISRFLKRVTPSQARAVAKKAKTSVAHLRHVAAGRRGMTADMAQRLSHASDGELQQQSLCEVCAKCPLVNVASR